MGQCPSAAQPCGVLDESVGRLWLGSAWTQPFLRQQQKVCFLKWKPPATSGMAGLRTGTEGARQV